MHGIEDQIFDLMNEVKRSGWKPTAIELGRSKTIDLREAMKDLEFVSTGHKIPVGCDGYFYGLPIHFNREPGIAISFEE